MWELLCLYALYALIGLLLYARLNFKVALLIVASAWLAIQYYAVLSSTPLMIGWCLLGFFCLIFLRPYSTYLVFLASY